MDDSSLTVFFDLEETLVTGRPARWSAHAAWLLDELRAGGCRLGVIANTGDLDRLHLAPHLPADFDWGLFDHVHIVLSGEVGVAKPSEAIFELALAAVTGRAVFVTENAEHALASQLAGLPCLRLASHAEVARVGEVLKAVGLFAPRDFDPV